VQAFVPLEALEQTALRVEFLEMPFVAAVLVGLSTVLPGLEGLTRSVVRAEIPLVS
jgi:hypothetical protein